MCIAELDCLFPAGRLPSSSVFSTIALELCNGGGGGGGGGGTPDAARSGISFGVTLQVHWNAPEAYVQLDLAGLSDLVTLLDALGMTGRHPDPAVVRVTR